MRRVGKLGHVTSLTFAPFFVALAFAGTAAQSACGGGTPPAVSPSEPSPAEEPSGAKPPDDDAPNATKASGSAAADDAKPKEPTSAEDLSAILQRVIEDEELDRYLKLTLPGRFPLKVTGNDLPSGISLTKGNQAVVFVESAPSKKDAVLVLTTVEIKGADATIGYRYDVEGIKGTAHLKKGDRGWELKNSRIVEH